MGRETKPERGRETPWIVCVWGGSGGSGGGHLSLIGRREPFTDRFIRWCEGQEVRVLRPFFSASPMKMEGEVVRKWA